MQSWRARVLQGSATVKKANANMLPSSTFSDQWTNPFDLAGRELSEVSLKSVAFGVLWGTLTASDYIMTSAKF